MTDLDLDLELIREDFATGAPWTMQTASDVVPPYEVAELIELAQAEAQPGESPFVAAQRLIAERAQMLELMSSQPLTRCFVPDEWWLFFHEMAIKRFAFPGLPLVFWGSGGIRSGKSFIAALAVVCHWLHARVRKIGNKKQGAEVYCMTSRLDQSARLQQRPMYGFMPAEVLAGGGRGLTGQERMKFKGGHFTDDAFCRFVQVTDDEGQVYEGGGAVTYAADTQTAEEDLHKLQGMDLTMAWLDEGKRPDILKTMRERVATGATITNEPWHRAMMFKILQKLEKRGTPEFVRLTPYEIGTLMYGFVVNTYTPKEGWNEMAASQLTGAELPEKFKRVAPELVGKPGVMDPMVPLIAYPVDKYCLVGFLPTSANKAKGGVLPAVLSTLGPDPTEEEIRCVLYGMVGDNSSKVFHVFGDKHLCDWADISRDGTLYEVLDFGAVKPPSIMWVIADKIGQLWQVQEWPCESVPVEIDGRSILPGPWAVASKHNRVNGDEGPAYKLRLNWNAARIVMEIWRMRRRIVDKMKETGAEFTGKLHTEALTWKNAPAGQPSTLEGPFALPHMIIPDPRGVSAALDGVRVGDAYEKCENGITFDAWDGYGVKAPSDLDGQREIMEVLKDTLHGGVPRMRINRECTNTRFMFNTYALPPFKDGPTRKDEACVEWFDLWKYLLRWEPGYVDPNDTFITDSGRR